jgi:hypothetical protein
MSAEELEPAEVVALQFTAVTDAADLAAWCGGEVARRIDVDAGSEECTVVLVPTAKGALPAHVGDWIVRRGEGDFFPYDAEKFALLHEPVV